MALDAIEAFTYRGWVTSRDSREASLVVNGLKFLFEVFPVERAFCGPSGVTRGLATIALCTAIAVLELVVIGKAGGTSASSIASSPVFAAVTLTARSANVITSVMVHFFVIFRDNP